MPANHVAIVTGANHGIGAAGAECLAADGVAVLLAYLRERVVDDPNTPERYQQNRMADGDEVAARINAAGGRAVAVEADLLDDSTPARLFDVAEAKLGPVDILVNNATGWTSGDSFTAGITDPAGRNTPGVTGTLFDRTFGVDARAGALMIAEFSRRLIGRDGTWGRIVGLTSGGSMGFPSEVTYGAAKAALENYTMSAAMELGRRGVTANMIHPPITDSGWVNDAVREFAATANDHFHVAEPAEVGRVIAWLCGDDARMITGNIIRMR
ncbi:MAG TPA: SDR family oxidoreductase [Ilumatobacteraceae bacterium]|nr:SDR family oxidoreductase [Ilumatobacteraceae bacterium]HRB03495.1 SDR family oxidoreductase [Ilumatobacteraceae bacterium]